METERTFGIELEFISKQYTAAAIAKNITELSGVRVESERYNHTVKRHWKIVTDASLSSRGGYGLELVSPPLKGIEGMEEVEKVVKALNWHSNIEVNRTCGFHVHHDINEFSIEQIKRIFGIYIKSEKAIDKMMPESRRGNNNGYCKSLTGGFTQAEMISLVKIAENMSQMRDLFNTRYLKLNLQSYVKYGTIEFRQHSGTVEFDKIQNWILFTQRIVTVASQYKVKFEFEEKPVTSTIDYLTRVLYTYKDKNQAVVEEMTKVMKFYRVRAKAIAA